MKYLAITSSGLSIYFSRQALVLFGGAAIDMAPTSRVKRWLARYRLFQRLFRLFPRCAAFIGNDILVVSYQKELWGISITEGKLLKKMAIRKGFSDVLTFCQMEDKVYYGDYGMNEKREPIHIYSLDKSLEPRVVYTFPAGSVRHIHNIIYDKWRQRFFIFTGDEGDKVGIYTANLDFSQVAPFLVGSQQYRAVIGHVTETSLLYATDAVMEDNFLYKVNLTEPLQIEKVCSLNGSVIYGCELDNGFAFSTTVEPYPSKKSKLLSILDNRRGRGIKTNEVEVYYVTDTCKVALVKKYEKDIWPMRLFQYGCVQFPALRKRSTNQLVMNPIAVKRADGFISSVSLV